MYKTISNFFESRGIKLRHDMVIEVGKQAKEASNRDKYPIMFMPSERFGKINMYHEDCISAAYFTLTDDWIQ